MYNYANKDNYVPLKYRHKLAHNCTVYKKL